MATADELDTDWQRSAGDFSCVVCGRKRLPASEFSKKQVEKALASLGSIPDKDIREGPDITHRHFVSGVCKTCTEEKEAKERAEAQARREGLEATIAEAEAALVPGERVAVELAERPFGLSHAKVDGAAEDYVVAKVTEGKPADKAGVKLGWRLLEVAGSSCQGAAPDATTALLKEVSLPARLLFEALPDGAEFCTVCQRVLAAPHFSRKMRTKPRSTRRCAACVEAAEASASAAGGQAAESADAAGPSAEAAEKPQSRLGELRALCAESAKEAEAVTGVRAARGGGYAGGSAGRGGRGRGRR